MRAALPVRRFSVLAPYPLAARELGKLMATTGNGTGANGTGEASGVESDRTAQPRSKLRLACDRDVAAVVAEILKARNEAGDLSASDANLADRLDFKSTTSVVALRKGEAPWHLGDLLALPRTLAMEIVTALVGKIERGNITQPSDLRDHALAVSEEEGALSREIRRAHADGVVDDQEKRAVARQALKLADKALDTYLSASPVSARGGR